MLLEFAPGETHSWLFAVTDSGFESFALPSRQTIEDAARDVHRLLTSRQPVRGENGRRSAGSHSPRRMRSWLERSRALSNLVLGPCRGEARRRVARPAAGDCRQRRARVRAVRGAAVSRRILGSPLARPWWPRTRS